jgi:hypothetical protein
MAGNGKNGNGNGMKKVRKGVHAHERNMHPGKPLTKISGNGNNRSNKERKGTA